MAELPPTLPNSPTSPDSAAHEFAMSCLEPLSIAHTLPPVTTRDFLESFMSPVSPLLDSSGLLLEAYLASQAQANIIRPCVILAPCPKPSTYTGSMVHTPVPSSALVPFLAPFTVEHSSYSIGKSPFIGSGTHSSDVVGVISPPSHISISSTLAESTEVKHSGKHLGKLLASAMSSYSARFSPYLTASHRGSAKSTATLPFRDNTLAQAIREIDAATAPQPVLPSAFFFKDSVA